MSLSPRPYGLGEADSGASIPSQMLASRPSTFSNCSAVLGSTGALPAMIFTNQFRGTAASAGKLGRREAVAPQVFLQDPAGRDRVIGAGRNMSLPPCRLPPSMIVNYLDDSNRSHLLRVDLASRFNRNRVMIGTEKPAGEDERDRRQTARYDFHEADDAGSVGRSAPSTRSEPPGALRGVSMIARAHAVCRMPYGERRLS